MENSLGLIIAIIGSAISIIGVVIAMMFWVRSESNELRKEQKEDRKDLMQLVRSIELEIRDFHSTLKKQDSEFKNHLLYEHKGKRE